MLMKYTKKLKRSSKVVNITTPHLYMNAARGYTYELNYREIGL